MKRIGWIIPLFAQLCTVVPAPAQLKAFASAEGHGALAWSECDRDNPLIIPVTNRNAEGPGSLRAAIDDAPKDNRAKFIIFRVGGTISTWGNVLNIRSPCLYIAGQTAPGGGIQIRMNGGGRGMLIDRNGAHDIIVRYLRIRPGDGPEDDAFGIGGGCRHILDHLSLQYGNDEAIGIQAQPPNNGGTPICDVTIQNSIIAATLRPHSTGLLIAGSPHTERAPVERISIHHNLFWSNAHRNPRVTHIKPVEFVNNVVANWHSRAGTTRYSTQVDFINNYLKAGPWSDATRIWYHDFRNSGDSGHLYPPSIYLSGNIAVPFQPNPNADQRNLYTRLSDAGHGSAPSGWFRSSPIGGAAHPVTIQPAAEAYTTVLAEAGATARLACGGGWVWVRDSLDSLAVNHTAAGTGPASDEEMDHQDDFGGYPTIAQGTACTDTDEDGVPDEWEMAHCGSATCVPGLSRATPGGYLWLELYLDGAMPAGGEDPEDPPPPPDPVVRRRRYFWRGVDTSDLSNIRWPDLTGLVGSARAYPNPARDSAFIVMYDSLTVGPPPVTDEEMDAICERQMISCSAVRALEVAE